MNKGLLFKILLGIFLLILAVLLIALFLTNRKIGENSDNNQTKTQENQGQLSLDPKNIPDSPSIVIPTSPSNGIEVNNFIKTAEKVEKYRVGLVDSANYGIAYSLPDSTFYITISAADFKEFQALRKEAEQQFLSKLNINQQQACQLQVQINTLPTDEPEVDSKNFPLSFCR